MKSRLPYASHLLASSEFVRQEIIETFRLPPTMVSAVPLAADPIFGLRSIEEVKRVKARYRLPKDYLLFVSTLEPRKNIRGLIKALQISKSDIPLVLTGWKGWGEKTWMEDLKKSRLSKRVYFTGFVPDEDLACLYNGAAALVYPSIYEGFGLPILEAMTCGCPVICSNTSSMPEVAGNASVLIDPYDSEELASAVDTVVSDTALREILVARGRERADQFTWRRTAAQVFKLFKNVGRQPIS